MVLLESARKPKAALSLPLLLAFSARNPKAEFGPPVVLDDNAS